MDKKMMAFGTSLLILKLLETKEMYGYQIIKELERQSQNLFVLKEGTLYPILHSLEQQGAIISTEKEGPNGRLRKYYILTDEGHRLLKKKELEWKQYSSVVSQILGGEIIYAGL